MEEQNKEVLKEETIEDLNDALKLIEKALDCVIYFNRYQMDMLETDNGPIDSRLEELRLDVLAKIKELKK